MNKKLLDKIALPSFLSEGLEVIKQNRLVNGSVFFDDLKRRLSILAYTKNVTVGLFHEELIK